MEIKRYPSVYFIVREMKKDLFNIRFKKVNNQINNPAQYNEIKKSIARLYTTLKNSK